MRTHRSHLAPLATMSAILMAAAIKIGAQPPSERGAVESVLHLLNLMAEPAPLTSAHTEFDNDASCVQCHTYGEGAPDEACLICHTLVSERMELALGWHGQVTDDCIVCHTDHEGREFGIMEFDMPAFNHDRAIWRLEGAHRDLECSVCHLEHAAGEENIGWQFLGVAQDCADCHSNPHKESLENSCASCHTQETWEDTQRFDHETMTDFPLANLHAGMDCASCHIQREVETHSVFAAEDGDCVSCHTVIESIFSGQRFAGALGQAIPDIHHGELDCVSCHQTSDPSVHLSLIAPRCVECHTPAHGQQLFETALLIEQSLQGGSRDGAGRMTGGLFAGLRGSDLVHNPVGWLAISSESSK